MKPFLIVPSLKESWKIVKSNLGLLIGVTIIILFLNSVPQIINSQLQVSDRILLLVLLSIVFWIINLLVQLGGIKISLKLTDKTKAEFIDLFNGYPLLLQFILGFLLYTVIVISPLILMAIAFFVGYVTRSEGFAMYAFVLISIVSVCLAVFLAIRLHFYSYFIVDKKYGPIQSLKKSFEITKGRVLLLIALSLVLALINILGFLALGVGLLITYPLSQITYAYVYRKLLGKTPAQQA